MSSSSRKRRLVSPQQPDEEQAEPRAARRTDRIVVDVGGTTTDVGALVKGFPRPASTTVDVGGVRTNFRMPDVFAIGLGGGTIVSGKGNNLKIGPQSVGYKLTTDSLIFGGTTLTTSDVAVALGLAEFGNKDAIADLKDDHLHAVRERINEMLTNAVERMRVSPDQIPVLAVGGGSILVPDKVGELPVIRPEHFSVANAVGAAIGQISGEVDRIFSLDGKTREEALAEARKEATEKATSELKKLQMMSPMSAEATVVRSYLDWMLNTPWKKRSRVKTDISAAERILNEDHYGLEDVKERILEFLAVQKRVKKNKGPVLCLVGPPGVGKTSLGESIARATNRKFVRMALGGVRDEAEIRGHRRTYIGSMPGKVIQKLTKVAVKNQQSPRLPITRS